MGVNGVAARTKTADCSTAGRRPRRARRSSSRRRGGVRSHTRTQRTASRPASPPITTATSKTPTTHHDSRLLPPHAPVLPPPGESHIHEGNTQVRFYTRDSEEKPGRTRYTHSFQGCTWTACSRKGVLGCNQRGGVANRHRVIQFTHTNNPFCSDTSSSTTLGTCLDWILVPFAGAHTRLGATVHDW